MKRLINTYLLTAFLGLGACSESSQTDSAIIKPSPTTEGKTDEKTEPKESVATTEPVEGVVEPMEINNEIEFGLGSVQVKSFDVLKSSIASCMGSTDITKVSTDMFIQIGVTPTIDENGRIPFLLPNEGLADGVDILEYERESLLGGMGEARSNIKADSLTASYLRTLELVGNVIAHNCSDSVATCSCGTEEEARTILEQCLPAIPPTGEVFDAAVTQFATQCAEGTRQSREAIAALISSYAFSEGR